jgi:hypothetical protein
MGARELRRNLGKDEISARTPALLTEKPHRISGESAPFNVDVLPANFIF